MAKIILAYEVQTQHGNELRFHNLGELSSTFGSYDPEELRIEHYTFDKSRLWAPGKLRHTVLDMTFDDKNIAPYEPRTPSSGKARIDFSDMQKRLADNNFTFRELITGRKRKTRQVYNAYQLAMQNPVYAFYFHLVDSTLPSERILVPEAAEYMDDLERARRDSFRETSRHRGIVFSVQWEFVEEDLIRIYKRHHTMAPQNLNAHDKSEEVSQARR